MTDHQNEAMNTIDIREIVQGAKTIAISGHERPDGDCIGSTLALYNYIKKIVPKDVKVEIFLDKLGPRYSYLKGYESVDHIFGRRQPFDVFFGLDSSTTDRYGSALKYYEKAAVTVCIDHHVSNQGFGTYRYIDPDASSTGELIFRLIPYEELDEDIAVCLYSAIISDTGVLKYSCTSPETLRAVARLIEFGFDFTDVVDRSFYEKTYTQNQLLGRALVESVRFLDNRAIFSVVTKRMLKFYDALPKDLDGIVNQLLLTKGVSCAILMYEADDMTYKVSMRSDDKVDVSKIALIYGGGGHVKAAGCTMKGTVHDVINSLSAYIEAELDRNQDDL